ncbi:MAG TPA: amino acid adenylation domain-containing protein, partial [Pyrinomonadaceae bacterium]|nr:amino acid adenylation domain-containing protein [Pyrinomonadaceae bacterium]
MSMAQLSLAEGTRENLIISELRTIFGRLFGMDASEIVVDIPFLELGADSLFLLQASHAVQDKFGVRVPFRMLLDECPTIETLAVHLGQALPAGFTLSSPRPQPELSQVQAQQTVDEQPVIHEVQLVAPLPELEPQPNGDYTLETIVREQLRLMSQQLELLGVAQPVIASVPTPAEPLPKPAVQPKKTVQEPAVADTGNRIEPEVFVPYQPVRIGGQAGLSARQRQHLDELIERLSRKTRRSKELMGNYRAVLADNRASAGFRQLWKEMFYPLAIERGIGSHVWDVDGNEYVDLTTGFGALIFGHTPQFVTDALQAQIEKGIQLGWQSPLAGECARLISELTGVERVAFCNSGTEAVMSALRLARTRTGRTKLVLFESSYHGTFDGVLVKRGEMDAEGTMRAVPVSPGVPLHMIENVTCLKYGSAESLEILRGCAHELAAVLIEPLQSRRPDMQPKEFLHELRKITTEAGAALIFDEVVCGFRFHPGGAQAIFDVQADLVTYGKAVGAGMPIGVLAGKAEYMDAIDGGTWNYGDDSYPEAITTYFAGTYFKNPLVMSAVFATLKHFKNSGPQLQEQLEQRTARLADRLNQFFEQDNVPIRANRFGSLIRFVFRRDLNYRELFFYYLLDMGVYICETRSCFLSTAHTDEDVDHVVKAVQYAVTQMRAGEFLPGGPTDSPDDKVKKDEKQTVPLTEAQKQLWILAQMGEDVSVAYNLSLTLDLHGTFNLPAMRQAVQTVVNRHEALRITFSPEGDFQRVSPELSLNIPFEDFTPQPPEMREAAAKDWLAREVKTPFDLEHGPLVRVAIARVNEQHHLFVFTAHHIVTDGVSLGIIVRELKALYTAQCLNASSHLPSPAPFSDFAAWQARMQQGRAMQEAETYWLEKFEGEVPVLDLPSDRPRPAVQTFAGARHRMIIDATLGERLKQLSAEHNSTLFMTLLTAFNVLLYRLTGQDDLIVGVPAAGQMSMGQRNLVGYCINLLPLRTQLSSTQSFKACLTSIKNTVADAYEYQNYPFSRLVKKLNIRRDAGRSPLVSVCFNLDRGSRRLKFHDLEDEVVVNSTGTAQFDIDLNVTELEGQLHFESDYSTDLFDESTINRWMGHFKTLLESLARDFDQSISEVPLLTGAEEHQLRVDWNNSRRDFPTSECFHTLFEAQVERTPGATAVTFEGRALTYHELNARANQLAHHLQTLGVGTETLAGICMDRTPEMLIAILGVFKAGSAYVPLDRTYPIERLAFILEDTNAVVLLTEQSVLQDLPEIRPRVFCMDSDWELVASESAENLTSTAKPDNLSYVIYTSGSTGTPKGVMVEHKGMLNHLFAKIVDLQLDAEDIVAQTASHCFDISVWQFLSALLVGGRVHICNDEETHNPALLTESVALENVSILELVPSLLRGILADIDISGRRPEWPFLRWVLVTGEALAPQLCREWLATYPEKPLLNAYGPTECSDDVTHHPILEPPSEGLVNMPIGRPVANMQMYVLDRSLRPVPVGVAGELFIGGIGVGRGYINLARRTAESFIPNAFVQDEGSRLYRSGDLVRYLPDGTIEFLGRVDHQVKVRGFRIELGEIEVVLEEHPAVRQAVVLVTEDTPGDKRLVGYIAAEQNIALAELRAHIKHKLPDYMVPAAFVVLDEFPLTPNGKIDRRALPAPDLQRLTLEEEFISPRNIVEQTLAEIWAQVIGVEKVGVNDNFFELGGDSILSIQIIARATRQGLRLNPRQVFQHQTIAELAAVVDSAPIIHGEEGLVTGPVPLTPVQHWFFEQNLANQHHWNQSVLLAVPHDLDAKRLENGFQHVLAHHDALRLRYTQRGTTWQQTNAGLDEPLRVLTFDFSALSDAEAKSAIAAKSAELQATLNLTWGPLVRPALFYRGDGREARLLIVVHHLAMDVISWQILLESLQTVYDQLGRGDVVQLPPKTTSFKQWAERLRDYAQSEELAQQLDYWSNERQAQVRPLPVDHNAGSNSEASTRRVIAKLSKEETRALLQDVPKTYRTLINDVLLLALAQSFAAWTGQRSMLVDVEGHGREAIFDDVDLSRTVGWFTAIAPVLLELGEPSENNEELQRIKEQVRAIPDGGIGYGLLRYLSDDPEIRERLSALPGSQVVFNYMGRMQNGDGVDERPFWRKTSELRGPAHSEAAKRKYLFEINGGIIDGCLQMVWTYSENVHARETVETLVNGFTGALRRLIEHRDLTTPAEPGQQDLDEIEATYELSPMQQGMLFHTLYEPASRAYFRHLRWTIRNLDVPVFKRAWNEVVARHEILRTFFTWEQSPTPLQAVRKRVTLTWNEIDWRGLSEAEQNEQLQSFLRADKELGFELSTAPVMRLTLIRLSEDVHEFVWSHHHLLLDGWTLPILRREVFALYEAFKQGQELQLANPRPFRDYIGWLQQQDLKEAERFWRETLRGFDSPTPLPIESRNAAAAQRLAPAYDEAKLRLSAETTAALQRLSRQQRVTLNSVMQSVWALLLAHYSGTDDVVFGAVVAGRP